MTRVYTAKEIAALVDVPVRTLQRWVDAGLVIASERTGGGGRRRYTLEDLRLAAAIKVLRNAKLRGERLRMAAEDMRGRRF